MKIPTHLSDSELLSEVKRCARCERDATAHLVAHLAEIDARRLHLGAGFPSLFAYCCEVLRLSEHETYNRIEAARAARKFPVILDRLAAGGLNLTTIRLLAPHLTGENHQELLAAASGRCKREVEELVAARFPRPDVAASVRKMPVAPSALLLPAAVPLPSAIAAPGFEASAPSGACVVSSAPTTALPPVVAALPPPRPLVTPLAADRYQIRFTASAKTLEKLRVAQDLLRHAVPTGDPAEIFDRALTALIEDLAKKKWAKTKRPSRAQGAAADSRHIPAKVKRAVWARDGGRCAFVARSGRRCDARGFLEFHHVEPYGVGGEATMGNIQLRCRAHNAYEADLFYGFSGPRGEAVVKERSIAYGLSARNSTRSRRSAGINRHGVAEEETAH